MSSITPKWAQSHFRIRNDNGGESAAGATWIAATDTNASIASNIPWRLRMNVTRASGSLCVCPPFTSDAWQLWFSVDGGANYNQVTTSSSTVKVAASATVANNVSTTQQISSGVFLGGDTIVNQNSATAISYNPTDGDEEYEWALNWNSPTAGTAVLFQVRSASGTVLANGYTATPSVTPTSSHIPDNQPMLIMGMLSGMAIGLSEIWKHLLRRTWHLSSSGLLLSRG